MLEVRPALEHAASSCVSVKGRQHFSHAAMMVKRALPRVFTQAERVKAVDDAELDAVKELRDSGQLKDEQLPGET